MKNPYCKRFALGIAAFLFGSLAAAQSPEIAPKSAAWARQVLVEDYGCGHATVTFETKTKIDRAEVYTSPDTGGAGKRKWIRAAATLKVMEGRVSVEAPLPLGTKAWFVNLIAGDLVASSELQCLQ